MQKATIEEKSLNIDKMVFPSVHGGQRQVSQDETLRVLTSVSVGTFIAFVFYALSGYFVPFFVGFVIGAVVTVFVFIRLVRRSRAIAKFVAKKLADNPTVVAKVVSFLIKEFALADMFSMFGPRRPPAESPSSPNTSSSSSDNPLSASFDTPFDAPSSLHASTPASTPSVNVSSEGDRRLKALKAIIAALEPVQEDIRILSDAIRNPQGLMPELLEDVRSKLEIAKKSEAGALAAIDAIMESANNIEELQSVTEKSNIQRTPVGFIVNQQSDGVESLPQSDTVVGEALSDSVRDSLIACGFCLDCEVPVVPDTFMTTKSQRIYYCTTCNESFNKCAQFLTHTKGSKHSQSLKLYNEHDICCFKCVLSFNSYDDYRVHLDTHLHKSVSTLRRDDRNLYYCGVCTELFYSFGSLLGHFESNSHRDATLKQYCDLCRTADFKSDFELYEHILAHSKACPVTIPPVAQVDQVVQVRADPVIAQVVPAAHGKGLSESDIPRLVASGFSLDGVTPSSFMLKGESFYYCTTCNESFGEGCLHLVHEKSSYHKDAVASVLDQDICCLKCKMAFKSVEEHRNHVDTPLHKSVSSLISDDVHTFAAYRCGVCKDTFTYFSTFLSHLQSLSHLKNLVKDNCDVCRTSKFHSDFERYEHVLGHPKVKPVASPFVDNSAHVAPGVISNVWVGSDGGPVAYCTVDQVTLIEPVKTVVPSLVVASRNASYECALCKISYPSGDLLWEHFKTDDHLGHLEFSNLSEQSIDDAFNCVPFSGQAVLKLDVIVEDKGHGFDIFCAFNQGRWDYKKTYELVWSGGSGPWTKESQDLRDKFSINKAERLFKDDGIFLDPAVNDGDQWFRTHRFVRYIYFVCANHSFGQISSIISYYIAPDEIEAFKLFVSVNDNTTFTKLLDDWRSGPKTGKNHFVACASRGVIPYCSNLHCVAGNQSCNGRMPSLKASQKFMSEFVTRSTLRCDSCNKVFLTTKDYDTHNYETHSTEDPTKTFFVHSKAGEAIGKDKFLRTQPLALIDLNERQDSWYPLRPLTFSDVIKGFELYRVIELSVNENVNLKSLLDKYNLVANVTTPVRVQTLKAFAQFRQDGLFCKAESVCEDWEKLTESIRILYLLSGFSEYSSIVADRIGVSDFHAFKRFVRHQKKFIDCTTLYGQNEVLGHWINACADIKTYYGSVTESDMISPCCVFGNRCKLGMCHTFTSFFNSYHPRLETSHCERTWRDSSFKLRLAHSGTRNQ